MAPSHRFQKLQDTGLPGARLMDYLTFRSGAAFVLSLLMAIFVGRAIIRRLQLMQVGEIIRDLDLDRTRCGRLRRVRRAYRRLWLAGLRCGGCRR